VLPEAYIMRILGIVMIVALSLGLANSDVNAKDKKMEMTALQMQAMQTRDIDGQYKVVFASVISILQDAGYRIDDADRESGLITGVGSSKGKLSYNLFTGFGKSKKSPMVSAFIEEINGEITRVRLNFVMATLKSNAYGSQPQDEEPILDAAVYADAFEKINQAVFVRQSMSAPPPAESSSVKE
jgi:hypothetical protein